MLVQSAIVSNTQDIRGDDEWPASGSSPTESHAKQSNSAVTLHVLTVIQVQPVEEGRYGQRNRAVVQKLNAFQC